MKAYRGSTGTAPLVLNLDTRWGLEVSIGPLPLYPEGRRGGAHIWSGSFGEKKNNFPPVGELRIFQLITQSAYRLRYPGHPISTFGNFYDGHTCSMNEAVSLLWKHPQYRWQKKRFLLEDHNAGSNVRVQRLAFLLCIRGSPPGWNIGSEALSRDRGSVWFSSVRPAKYWDNTLNYAMRDSSHHSTLYQPCSSENVVHTNQRSTSTMIIATYKDSTR